MKTLLSRLTLLIIVVSTYSCSTSGEFSVMKRRHNKGYYVDFGKKKNEIISTQTESKKGNTASTAENLLKAEILTEKENDYPLTASTDETPVVITDETNENPQTSQPGNYSFQEKKVSGSWLNKRLEKKIEKKLKRLEKSKPLDDDTDTLILIILCLFPILALVAIYIKDGKSITNNFWIDLLLHFICLWWLFAILVVLDIVNFA